MTLREHSQRYISAAAAVAALSVSAPGAVSANPDITKREFTSPKTVRDRTDIGLRNGSFLIVPIPFANPAIGEGLTIGAGYLFKLDEEAETSFFGLGALGSSNGSEAYGFATDLSFGSGWKLDAALAEADIKYDLFIGDVPFPIRQTGDLFNGGIDYDVSETVSIGGVVRYLNTSISLNSSGTVIPPELLPDLELELMTVGARLLWDLRDDTDYPTSGSRLSVTANHGFTLSGDARGYEYGAVNYDTYRSLGPNSVVATRASLCGASTDAPFFDQCSLGFIDAFRGFSPTQFFDSRLISAQVEYRQRLSGRFGFVVFAGLGWTADSFSDLTDDGERSAVGFGGRYRVSKKFPVDLSVDVTYNNDEDGQLYIYVGQRF